MDKRIKFYSQNTNLLTPKPKSSFRHLKQGIQEFQRKYVLVPADKAANNFVVVCRLHYVNIFKQELDGTRAYLETNTDEMSVVNAHSVCVNEGQDELPTMYWLPKLHKRPYKDHTKLEPEFYHWVLPSSRYKKVLFDFYYSSR